MSYSNVAAPGGGYTPYAAPTAGYTPAAKPGPGAAQGKQPGKQAWKFTELPVTGGVGEFHTNHFIGYSAYEKLDPMRASLRAQRLTELFYNVFSTIFSEKNVASAVVHADRPFQGSPTVEFTVGGNTGNSAEKIGGLFHSDWVAMRLDPPSVTFVGSTLRREWITEGEAKLAAVVAAANAAAAVVSGTRPKPAAEVIAARLIRVNQHHFLAGRRSWKVGYDDALHRFYVETAALERNSLCEFASIEGFGVLRDVIVQLWAGLIDNFESHAAGWISSLHIPEVVPSGYLTRGNASYRFAQDKTAAQAIASDWFAPVLLRHPGLVKGLVLS